MIEIKQIADAADMIANKKRPKKEAKEEFSLKEKLRHKHRLAVTSLGFCVFSVSLNLNVIFPARTIRGKYIQAQSA